MRGLGMTNLGAVCNFEYAAAADDSDASKAAARLYDGYYNRFFLSGIFRGEYPEDVMEGLGPHMPEGWQDDFDLIGAPVDWVGLNYYTRKLIAPDDSAWPSHKDVEGPLPKTAMGWEIYPDGLLHFLRRVHEDYTRGLPLYVTENGMAAPDEVAGGTVDDPHRIAFLEAHLDRVRPAIAEGVPVAGYFVWSLLDNYEWALGYEKRFGLVHVDFDSLKRTPKASYHALSAALSKA
jgi:beta-glucosidase